MTLPSLITFGSLTPLPTQDQILQLQEEFRHKASLFRPIVEAVYDLDTLWAKLTDEDPSLKIIDGRAAIQKLKGLLSSTVNEHIRDDRRNILVVPITILLHVVQYLSFVENSQGVDQNSILENVASGGGVQGLCAGLLTAQVVSSAATIEDIVTLSCTSLRLAFCIGAYVDTDQVSSDGNIKSATLAVRWKAPYTLEDIQKILLNYRDVCLPVSNYRYCSSNADVT
ncbi:hypothetical protein ONZ43_g462 [Nemania bipapillata]|uniref:Uncharacterized protein n=1 Tax=Nemania bipapillata TaxID=110536 RepID=A0ACC2J811_9PEZI|nr:hypothetical protein ONZ43_g462 [Nemania bipapillata]